MDQNRILNLLYIDKFSENSHVVASRGWGFHNLNMVMQCILCSLLDIPLRWAYHQLLYIISHISHYGAGLSLIMTWLYSIILCSYSDIPLIWACQYF